MKKVHIQTKHTSSIKTQDDIFFYLARIRKIMFLIPFSILIKYLSHLSYWLLVTANAEVFMFYVDNKFVLTLANVTQITIFHWWNTGSYRTAWWWCCECSAPPWCPPGRVAGPRWGWGGTCSSWTGRSWRSCWSREAASQPWNERDNWDWLDQWCYWGLNFMKSISLLI